MKYLSEQQWHELLMELGHHYKGTDVVSKANKGQLFEFLVEYLLEKLFTEKELVFEGTKTSHDGSKDFWGIDEDEKLWWVECKNYSENISVTQLAPTLFMAELNEVENLIFFSYSKLNVNLKRRIGQYAAKHKKNIYLYDDDVLEQMLLGSLPQSLQKHIPIHYAMDDSSSEILIFYEKNPLFYNHTGFSGYYKIEELRMGEVYNLNLLVINKSLFEECNVTATIQNNDDVYYFEFLSEQKQTISDKRQINFLVQPNQAIMDCFMVRLIKCKDGLTLPSIEVEVRYDNRRGQKKAAPKKKYNCVSSIKDVFIGEHYENIVKTVSKTCLGKQQVAGFMIYGNGGTGKTRILDECYVNLLKHGYKVLNFTGFDVNSDWKNVIREIVFNLFSIQDDIALGVLCETLPNDISFLVKDASKASILKFLRILMENEPNPKSLSPYYKVIFEKLRQGKYAFVMDNLQSYSSELVLFFNEMLQYYLSNQRPVQICLLFSLNTSLVFHDAFSSFLSSFINLKENGLYPYFYCTEIKGFLHEDQAIVFLKTILRMDDFPLNLTLLRRVLSRFSLRPKYLEQVANYLLGNNCVRIENDRGYVPDEEEFRRALENVPTDYQTLFRHNYTHIISAHPHLEQQAEKAIALLHIFGKITHQHINAFGLESDIFNILCKHGIIDNKGDSIYRCYVFEHDLSEECLTQHIYPNIIETAAGEILRGDKNIDAFLSPRHVEYILCLLVSDGITLDELNRIDLDLLRRVPNKLQFGFCSHSLRNFVRFMREMSEAEFIERSSMYCKYVRDHISEKQASSMFDTAYEQIECFLLNERQSIKEHFSFVVHMAENKIRIGEHYRAMQLYRSYLKKISDFVKLGLEINDKLSYAKAYIYNRIFVCGKLEDEREKYLDYLNDSKKICAEYDFHDIMFENYFDEANLYMEDNSNLNIAKSCLKEGFAYYDKMRPERKEKFEVNHYSKKIQYLCLEKQFDKALEMVSQALQLLEYNDSINYHLFFKSRYLKYKVISLLALKRTDTQLVATLEDYEITLGLLGGDYKLELSYFKAKYAFLISDMFAFGFYFKMVYDIVDKKEKQQENCRYSLMLEDLIIKYRLLGCDKKSPLIFSCKSLNALRASRVLELSAQEFDLFAKSYKSKAPLTDATGLDGYFF